MNISASTQTTLQLFGGVAGVLILASSIGALLKWRVAAGRPNSVIDNLNARVNAWWVMVAVIGLSFAFGKGGVIVLFYLISFYALREFISLAYTRRGDHHAIAAAFYIGLPVQYFWCGSTGTGSIRSSSRSTPSSCCRFSRPWAATRSAFWSAPPRSSGA